MIRITSGILSCWKIALIIYKCLFLGQPQQYVQLRQQKGEDQNLEETEWIASHVEVSFQLMPQIVGNSILAIHLKEKLVILVKYAYGTRIKNQEMREPQSGNVTHQESCWEVLTTPWKLKRVAIQHKLKRAMIQWLLAFVMMTIAMVLMSVDNPRLQGENLQEDSHPEPNRPEQNLQGPNLLEHNPLEHSPQGPNLLEPNPQELNLQKLNLQGINRLRDSPLLKDLIPTRFCVTNVEVSSQQMVMIVNSLIDILRIKETTVIPVKRVSTTRGRNPQQKLQQSENVFLQLFYWVQWKIHSESNQVVNSKIFQKLLVLASWHVCVIQICAMPMMNISMNLWLYLRLQILPLQRKFYSNFSQVKICQCKKKYFNSLKKYF